jgi:iron complex transport system substrate-binding protein
MRGTPRAENFARLASSFAQARRRVEHALRIAVAVPALFACLLTGAEAREVTDSAGRKVQVPDRIERIMAAGPPASVLVAMLAPAKLIGWNLKPREAELPYLPPVARDLPEIGRLTGRGNTANLEVVMNARPDLIVDFGSVNATYVSLADRVQGQTGIPYLLVDGRFANTVAALRMLGSVFGAPERAEQLARRTEAIIGEVDQAARGVPTAQHPRVYLARRPSGLETGNRGSINTEIIERAGGVNVVEAGRDRGGLMNVSLEQVLQWNPDTIISTDQGFAAQARAMVAWSTVEAVRRNRIFLSPNLPYGWIDGPPSVNRILGLQWLARLFFPGRLPTDIRSEARDFYQLFYQVELHDRELDRLLEGAK